MNAGYKRLLKKHRGAGILAGEPAVQPAYDFLGQTTEKPSSELP
jgi:hypothetical protein